LGKHKDAVFLEDIKETLRSHDDPHNPVCVDVPTVLTFGSVVYELCDTPRLHVTKGAPCRTEYKQYSLKKGDKDI